MTLFLELLNLFWIFFKIGIVTFGGGYAMIPLIRQELVSNGYLTLSQIDRFIGIAESTPGPFSVNVATFAGFENFGVLGSVVATLGLVLPSFIIILLIASLSAKFLQTKAVRSILMLINPLTIGFIFAAGLGVTLTVTLGDYLGTISVDYVAIGIFIIVLALSLIFKKINPIYLILISGVLGLILYQIF
jgi:chromate transporter